jgi:hypothetical protein
LQRDVVAKFSGLAVKILGPRGKGAATVKHDGETLTLGRKSTVTAAPTLDPRTRTGQDNPNPAPLGATGSPQADRAGWREAVGSMGQRTATVQRQHSRPANGRNCQSA